MTIFKAYIKIIKSNIALVSLYTVVFLTIAIVIVSLNSSDSNMIFSEKKVKVQIINNDEDSSLVQGLLETIGEKNEIVKSNEDTESVQDALFFRKVEYVVKVPENFTEDFYSGKNVDLEKIQIDKSFSSYYMDSLINKYLNTWKIYKDANKELSDEAIKEKVIKDLKLETKTALYNDSKDTSILDSMNVYFNSSAYALLGTIILGVSICMSELNKDKIRQRNLCSPTKPRTISTNIILGNCILSFSIYLITTIAGIVFFREDIFTSYGLLMIINLFIITICCMFISMIVGVCIKSRSAISAAATTISLGLCFISGVFIPLSFIGDKVKFIASFTPVYWFVKGNNDIISISNFSVQNLKPVIYSLSIELIFAICLLAVYLVINKQKVKKSE